VTGGVAVVTGAGRGVGRVVAGGLARAGMAVALVARSADELEAAEAEIRSAGGTALALAADVTDGIAIGRAVARASADLGPIDLLVDNAGTLGPIGPPWEAEPDAWWRDVEVTLRGAFLCVRAVMPSMLERGAGRIVNISSYVAVRPSPYLSGYAAGKAALVSFTEALHAAGAPHGVRAFAVTPGFVETAITDRLRNTEAGRRWLPETGAGGSVDPERTAELIRRIAAGELDALGGRFIHALDDVDEVLRRMDEVERDDLYAPRLRRLR
jgi:NAD(P)-dependent dehydrogenase (short-subunit alcohol dehydrogenase family)